MGGHRKETFVKCQRTQAIAYANERKNCPNACDHSKVYFTFLTVFSKNSFSVLLYHIVKLDFS